MKSYHVGATNSLSRHFEQTDEGKGMVSPNERSSRGLDFPDQEKQNMEARGRPEPVMDTQMRTGTCKWFNSQKGFGFITPDGGGPDVFVHQSVIKAEGFRSLGDGERVEYFLDLSETEKDKAAKVTGPNGHNVVGTLPKPRFKSPPYSPLQQGYYHQMPLQMPPQAGQNVIWPGTSAYTMGSYVTGYTTVTQPPLINYQNIPYVMKQATQQSIPSGSIYNQQRYLQEMAVQKQHQSQLRTPPDQPMFPGAK